MLLKRSGAMPKNVKRVTDARIDPCELISFAQRRDTDSALDKHWPHGWLG